MEVHNIIIIGSGPAGYTAGLYSARAGLQPMLFEGYMAGGQLMITTDIENFPGYPEGIAGPAMMQDLKKQAERFGTQCLLQEVDAVDFSQKPFKVVSKGREYFAKAVIVATGATARYLGIDSEKKLMGKGVSACATCDGAFFKGEKIAVVGGGDTALEEALFLTRFGKSVTIIHRRDALRASKFMQEKAQNHEKINFMWDSVVVECVGDKGLESLKIKNVKTGTVTTEPFGALFVAIGHQPNTSLFKESLELDEQGYIVTKNKSSYTNIDGVFACGDVQDKTYRQAITAAGSGCMAAIDAERWLEAGDL
jgi:thioredoxin reductase (NADPH)